MNLPNTKNPQVGVLLEFYEDRLKGAITQDQLEAACHFWAYENAFSEMSFIPYPATPRDIIEWKRMSSRQKEAAPEETRARMEKLDSGFYDHYHGILIINRTNLTNLLEMEKTFLRYDTAKAATVRNRIDDFKSKGVVPW
jgi:hypothetical protein